HSVVSVAENAAAGNTGSFADFDAAVSISASTGTLTQSGSQSGAWSWSGTGDEKSPYTVTVTATNADGTTATTTFGVSFTDVSPPPTDHRAASVAEKDAAGNTGSVAAYDDAVSTSAASGRLTQSDSKAGTWSWSGTGDEKSPYTV